MVSRLALAGACALGLATVSAAPALADTQPQPQTRPTLYVPAAVQVWSPDGLVRTIDCPTLDAAPACDPGQWPHNIDAISSRHGGYRLLARSGRWFEQGGNQATFDAIEAADASGGPGATRVVTGFHELVVYEPTAAQARAARRSAKASKKRAARRAAKQRAASAKR